MNDFFDSTQGSLDIEAYYQKFLALIKYAPAGMTQEVKFACFVSGLQSLLKERLQALRLMTFTDVLEVGKPIEKKLSDASNKRKVESIPTREPAKRRPEGESSAYAGDPIALNLRDKARGERLCFTCMDPGHQKRDCPLLSANFRQIG